MLRKMTLFAFCNFLDINFSNWCTRVAMCNSAGSIYRSIAIFAKVRYRYLVVSRYLDIFGIECPLFDTFDTSRSRPFDDVNAKAQHRCR